MRFIFKESEEVHRLNKKRGRVFDNFTPEKKTKPNFEIAVINKKATKVHKFCRDCKDPLQNTASKYLGICPSCDNL